jgi:hypothetical protein
VRFRVAAKKPQPVTEWHVWFAWHPVRAAEGQRVTWCWLERVERKGEPFDDSLGGGISWQYQPWNPVYY